MEDTVPSSPPTDEATIAFHRILEAERAKAYQSGYAFGVREAAERADQWASHQINSHAGTQAAKHVRTLLTDDRCDYIETHRKSIQND